MKYFGMSYEEVVFNRSFINIMLLNRSIPSFKLDNDEDGGTLHGKGGKWKKTQRQRPRNETEFFMQFM